MSLPFSPARISGNFVFLSGQIGLKDGKLVSDDIQEQTIQAIENASVILKDNDLSLGDVIDVTAFLINQEDYGAFNEAYMKSFSDPFPTRTAVTVKSLPLGAKVEIKIIARMGK